MNKYLLWMKKFMEAWQSLNGVEAAKMFSKSVAYYETPLDIPCPTWDDVLNLWLVVKDNQRVLEYTYEILCSSDEKCLVHWTMERLFHNKKQNIDGVFQISLESSGLCNYFKQWRFTKEI